MQPELPVVPLCPMFPGAAARMRDSLVHHYFDINLDVLWQTITEDLPQLPTTLPSEDQVDRRAAR